MGQVPYSKNWFICNTCSLSDIFWKSSSVSSSASIMSNSGSMTPSRSGLFVGPLKTNLGTGAEFFFLAAAAEFFFASCWCQCQQYIFIVTNWIKLDCFSTHEKSLSVAKWSSFFDKVAVKMTCGIKTCWILFLCARADSAASCFLSAGPGPPEPDATGAGRW